MKKLQNIRLCVLALIIALLLCFAVGVCKFYRVQPERTAQDNKLSFAISKLDENSAINLASEPVSNYASASSSSVKVLTATVESESVKTLVWSMSFKNENDWSESKLPDSYIKLVVSADTLSARVSCLKAFGDPIIITVAFSDNSNINATCRCDYECKSGNGITFENATFILAGDYLPTSYYIATSGQSSNTILRKLDYGSELDESGNPINDEYFYLTPETVLNIDYGVCTIKSDWCGVLLDGKPVVDGVPLGEQSLFNSSTLNKSGVLIFQFSGVRRQFAFKFVIPSSENEVNSNGE